MDVYERRVAKLLELLAGISRAELSERSGIAASTLSRYLSSPSSPGHKRISEINARKLERAGRKPENWLDGRAVAAPPPQPHPSARGLAHDMIHGPWTLPPTLSWEEIMRSSEFPGSFVVAMPDDALAPNVPRGTRLIFEPDAEPVPLRGVLVQDATGRRYIRRYAEAPGGAWRAEALREGYVSLESERDGLALLAVMVGRLDGAI